MSIEFHIIAQVIEIKYMCKKKHSKILIVLVKEFDRPFKLLI